MGRTMEEIIKDDKEFLELFEPFDEQRKANIIFYMKGMRDADALNQKAGTNEPELVGA